MSRTSESRYPRLNLTSSPGAIAACIVFALAACTGWGLHSCSDRRSQASERSALRMSFEQAMEVLRDPDALDIHRQSAIGRLLMLNVHARREIEVHARDDGDLGKAARAALKYFPADKANEKGR